MNCLQKLYYFQCGKDQFTCDDGVCIAVTKRCDNILHCSDGSDENFCTPLSIDKSNYKKIFPYAEDDKKTEVTISLNVKSIYDIEELQSSFTSEMAIYMEWFDPRITYKNLNPEGNFLTSEWQNNIWLPPLYFANTRSGNVQLLGDLSQTVQILREGDAVLKDVRAFNEGELYSGYENELQLFTQLEKEFKCDYNFTCFPFDTQYCSINIKIPWDTRNYSVLKSGSLKYSGLKHLLQFTVDQFTMELSQDQYSIEAKFQLKRNPNGMIISTYIPSFCVICMTILSLFLREQFHFGTSIMLVLTALLCFYSLQQSVTEEIPKTSYLKFIDYWNICSMAVPFFIFAILMVEQFGGQASSRKLCKGFKTMTKIVVPMATAAFWAYYWVLAWTYSYGDCI